MASFVWMLLTEPPTNRTPCGARLAGEESESEDTPRLPGAHERAWLEGRVASSGGRLRTIGPRAGWMPRTGSTYPVDADGEADRDQDEPCDEEGNRKPADTAAISVGRSRPGRLAQSGWGLAPLERSKRCTCGAPDHGLARTGRGGRADRAGNVLACPRLDRLAEGGAGAIRSHLARSRPAPRSSVARASAAAGPVVVGGRRLLGPGRRGFRGRRRVGRRRRFRLSRGRVFRPLGHVGFFGLGLLFLRHLDIGGRRRLSGRRRRASRPDCSEEDGEDENRSLPHSPVVKYVLSAARPGQTPQPRITACPDLTEAVPRMLARRALERPNRRARLGAPVRP